MKTKIRYKKKTIKHSAGFTLIELLVVIGIIGLLSTLVVVQVKTARQKAKIAKAQHDIDVIATAILALGTDTGQWPGHQDAGEVNNSNGNEICGDGCNFGLSANQAGIVATDGSYNGWSGPYMRSIGLDPWGNEYFFDTDYQVTADGQPCSTAPCQMAAVVGSYGPDGVGNNQYTSDDIIKILAK
jgi:general secretion pathway protein G